jgi:hypothetical protein
MENGMKIKSKLALNSVTIPILMAVIGAAAVIGIHFNEKNIFYASCAEKVDSA